MAACREPVVAKLAKELGGEFLGRGAHQDESN